MLSAVRRVGLSAGARALRTPCRAATTFADRERGEEAMYIKHQEDERRKAALRAKMEAILELEDHHADKQDLVEVLEGTKQAETTWTRLQKWNYFVPLGILVGVPALTNEFAVIDAETQILGAFAFTVGAVYNEFGNAIGETFDDESKAVETAMKTVDESLLENVHEAVATNESLLDLEADVQQVHALTDDMAAVQAEYLNHLEEHKYRDAVAKKLDALVALEDTAATAIRNRMLTEVHASVLNTFKTDAKAKEAALQQALTVLGSSNSKTGAAMKKDIVGDYFASALKTYKDNYAKLPAGGDEIVVQLEKDMTAIMQAPTVSHEGGNVYDFRNKAAGAH